MLQTLKIIMITFWTLVKFVLSPIVVFGEEKSKVLHFYAWAIAQLGGMYLGYAGETGLGLGFLAIIKEEVIDGLLKWGTKDMRDAFWSFRGIVWAIFFYILVLQQIL